MKITPVGSSGGIPGIDLGNTSTQRTSPDRIAAAKAIAAGQTPIRVSQTEQPDRQVARAQKSIRMRTNVSPDRQALPIDELDQVQTQSAIDETVEAAPEATEETKPLSPQFAALAKQRRALQQERAKLEQEKAALAQTTKDGSPEVMARLKSNPLGVLSEAGVTYDQLTEAILNGQGSNPELAELKAKIADLEKGIDTKLTDRDAQAETQALNEMRREADGLVAQGDEYEMIRATKSVPKVIELIHRTYKKYGEVMDVTEALNLYEDELIRENLELAKLKKIQSRLSPQETLQQTQPQRPQQDGMRTLTNRDTARPLLSRRDRMMAAFEGRLKK